MPDLSFLFNPKSVALIGASENIVVGRTMMFNLLKSPFGGTIYPINPKRPAVLGVKAVTKISELGQGAVDLAIIAIAAKFVPSAVKECADNGVKSVIIVSAGFAEMGEPGRALEREIMSYAKPVGMRVVGPNCLGLSYSASGLNATFAADMIHKGSVAFLSQSGALCTAMLDYSLKAGFGFSAFVSVGSMLDVDWPDLIEFFGEDANTSAITIYMETVGKAHRFLEACQKVTPKKPIVVVKAGRSAAGVKAASSHTGALAGADEVADAAFERAGVLRVLEISDLFALVELLNNQPRPRGPRLTIITNAGGPGVLTTDALTTGGG
jgi:acetyltransferase